MKYIFEKDINMPLCAYIDGKFIDFLTNNVIDNNMSKYLENGLKKKILLLSDIDFKIYKIKSLSDKSIIGYNYVLNGTSNYLDYYKQPIKNVNFIKKKLINKEYFQELIWGDTSGR